MQKNIGTTMSKNTMPKNTMQLEFKSQFWPNCRIKAIDTYDLSAISPMIQILAISMNDWNIKFNFRQNKFRKSMISFETKGVLS